SMVTPIGTRQGTMSVMLEQNKISGTLDILENTGNFHGTVNDDDCCTIEGSIISLTQTIEYIATGKITKDKISLQLKGKKNTFLLFGVAALTEGEKIYE
ncbi:MAG: hypothetical protein ACI4EV_00450, partial [Lachnospiraceae bacterium]